MKWVAITTVFFSAFAKFMFAPLIAQRLDLNFTAAWLSTFSGGLVSALIFFFMSEYFMKRHHRKKIAKNSRLKEVDKTRIRKKNFSKRNRAIIKVKNGIGQYGICLFAPLFLSVPIGSIICAKFFKNKRNTFSIIIIGLAMNSFLFTLLFYKAL